MTSYGDARRSAAAHADLTRFVGTGSRVGLVLFDEDHQEQVVIEGEVVRIGVDSLLFRHEGMDEEIALATISKRVLGDEVLPY
jgi:hypothetical protein